MRRGNRALGIYLLDISSIHLEYVVIQGCILLVVRIADVVDPEEHSEQTVSSVPRRLLILSCIVRNEFRVYLRFEVRNRRQIGCHKLAGHGSSAVC